MSNATVSNATREIEMLCNGRNDRIALRVLCGLENLLSMVENSTMTLDRIILAASIKAWKHTTGASPDRESMYVLAYSMEHALDHICQLDGMAENVYDYDDSKPKYGVYEVIEKAVALFKLRVGSRHEAPKDLPADETTPDYEPAHAPIGLRY